MNKAHDYESNCLRSDLAAIVVRSTVVGTFWSNLQWSNHKIKTKYWQVLGLLSVINVSLAVKICQKDYVGEGKLILVVMLDNAQWKSTNGSIAASIVIFQQFCGDRWWFCLRFGDWLSLTWLVILIDSKFTRLATRWLWTEAIVVVSLSNLGIYYFLFFSLK